MTTTPTIRMFNEYGCPWPFWGGGGLLDEEDFPLPPDLTADILAWTRNFDEHFDPFEGWPTKEQCEAHRREGEQLAERVQDAVGPGITIDFDAWESAVDGPDRPWWKRIFRSRVERA